MPKAVIQTYGMAIANYINIAQSMGLRADDTTLNYLPLFHTGGINLTTLPALIMGARVLITPGFDLESMVGLLEAGRLDTFFGVPAIYQAISLHARFDELDLSRVRCWGCGGAPMPDKMWEQFAARGATVLNGVGMTETGPTVFLMDEKNAPNKIGSVGKPQLLAAVRLVGPDGTDVSRGETGELWFSGLGITPGYFKRPAATAESLVDGAWLRSGDLGRQDKDGYYYIVGRLKDIYISGGENVYAAEVENQLAEHPDILEAAVIGVADKKSPFVGDCDYDAAGEMLKHLYPGLDTPGTQSETGLTTVTLPGATSAGLSETAYLFIPPACTGEQACSFHLVLHGCAQSSVQVGTTFMEQSGYLPWAEANDIVLAFPQVIPGAANPFACWDWWGYTGAAYRWRDGAQMKVLTDWISTLAVDLLPLHEF